MQRLILLTLLICALGAVVWSGLLFYESRQAGALPLVQAHQKAAILVPQEPQIGAAPVEIAQRTWPAVFGQANTSVQRPSLETTTPSALPVPNEPNPADGFILTGLIYSGEIQWAVILSQNEEMVVRAGDRLPSGIEVIDVLSDGVVVRQGPQTGKIAFPE